MSVYQRFYVKTKFPREVEQTIIHTLGGDAWLEPTVSGEFLRPVSLIEEDDKTIRPARDTFGNLVGHKSVNGRGKDGSIRWFSGALSRLLRRPDCAEEAVSSEIMDARWYWLPSTIDSGSPEAINIARTLYASQLVEVVAEDNEISGQWDESVAHVIGPDHWFLETPTN